MKRWKASKKSRKGWSFDAQFRAYVRRDKKRQRKYLPKSKSVRSVSGGLPSLGKKSWPHFF
jgi:hypothetical protein